MKSRDNIMIALASGDKKSKAMAATALTLGIGNKPNPPPENSFKTRASNCVLVTIVIICVCVLVACGVMIVREYALAKGYHITTCKVSDKNSLQLFPFLQLIERKLTRFLPNMNPKTFPQNKDILKEFTEKYKKNCPFVKYNHCMDTYPDTDYFSLRSVKGCKEATRAAISYV